MAKQARTFLLVVSHFVASGAHRCPWHGSIYGCMARCEPVRAPLHKHAPPLQVPCAPHATPNAHCMLSPEREPIDHSVPAQELFGRSRIVCTATRATFVVRIHFIESLRATPLSRPVPAAKVGEPYGQCTRIVALAMCAISSASHRLAHHRESCFVPCRNLQDWNRLNSGGCELCGTHAALGAGTLAIAATSAATVNHCAVCITTTQAF